MTTTTLSRKIRILQLTFRSNLLGADQFTYGSPRFTGRHLGESPISSIRGTASDRDVSDLPAYILFPTGNCLRMTSRNSKPRATRKAVNSDLHNSVSSIFRASSATDCNQSLIRILTYYIGEKTDNDAQALSDAYNVMSIVNALPAMERAYEALDNPSLKLKTA